MTPMDEQDAGITRRALLGTAAAGGLAIVAGALASSPESAAAAPPPTGALTPARFSLQIDGQEVGAFTELLGIQSEIEPTDFASGSEIIFKRLPGKQKTPTVILRRGFGQSDAVWDWHQSVLQGAITARKSASLVMYDSSGKPVARYHLENAWPSKIVVGPVEDGSAALAETVTLVTEFLQRVAV